jgi:predicted ATPase/DNA-binding SARP family transcriptional activator
MPTSVGVAEGDVLRLYLLGGFHALFGSYDTPMGAWKLRRARSLVKLLALAPRRRMHRERIIELLWPGQDLENPDNSLHQAIYAARHALGGSGARASRFFQAHDGIVALAADDLSVWVDVEAFEIAAASARQRRQPEAYRAALDLYCGPLLPEDGYEDWVSGRAESLRRLYVDLLVELAGAYEHDGRYGDAIVELLRAVDTDGAREDAHVGLMRLHALTGQRSDALRRFETLRRVLLDELDAEPQAASARLYEAIASNRFPPPGVLMPPDAPTADGTGAVSSPRVRNASPALNRFIGRAREVDEISRLLAGARLVTIVGPGGSGKTRLALEVAAVLGPGYAGAAWLVELASVERSSVLPQALAASLDVIERPDQPLLATITATLAARRPMLVALDNCEHLIAACAELAEMLIHACPNVTLLCTSREPLHIPGEVVWRLSSLGLPQTDHASDLEAALACDSVQLFLDRARALAPTLALDARTIHAMARICGHLDGLPLAIELAAARVGTVGLEEIANRLASGLSALGRGSRTAPTRQQTLVATLDWSYASLTERERRLFRCLAVFPMPFDLEAAEWVSMEGADVSADDGDAQDTLDTLAALVDKSLVTIDESAGATRYRLLEPLRQYAEQRLNECGERQTALRKRDDWGLAITERANGLLWGPSHAAAVARLEAAYPALRATLEWRLHGEGAAPAAARLIAALWQFWVLRGMVSEGRYWVAALLASADLPDDARAEALMISFGLMIRPDDYTGAAAREMVERSVALYRALGESEAIGQALRMLGIQAFMAGDLERAETAVAESLARARATGDLAGEGLSLHGLSVIAWARGAYPEASAHMEAALALFRAVEGRPRVTNVLFNMGGLTPFDASPHAVLVEEETWVMLGALSGAALVGHTLAHLGALARVAGDLEAARTRLEESVAWFRHCGHQAGLAQAFGQLGAVLRVQGEFTGAHALLEESLALRSQLGDRRGVGMTLNNMALVAVAEEDFSRAEALLAQVIASLVEMGDLAGVRMTRDLQAFCALRSGDHRRAQALYYECLMNCRASIHDPLEIASTLTGMGAAAAAGGAAETARACFDEAAEIYERIGDERRAALLRSRPLVGFAQ